MKQRVLVVDDSPFMRRIIGDMISAEPDLELVGTGQDGEEAVRLAAALKPDVVTLDVEMPRAGGLEALRAIMSNSPAAVLMVSSLTAKGTGATIQALEAGAFDFVCKPEGGVVGLWRIREELIAKIRSAKHARVQRRPFLSTRAGTTGRGSDRVVLIASSTGGPKALSSFFETLPNDFSGAILIVQHMPAGFTESLAKRLNGLGSVPCRLARPGDRVRPGLALMAPGGLHMVVEPGGDISFSDEPSLHGVRPAADYLFNSAALVYKERCIGIVMTGMGKDGAEGALAVRRAGGVVFAESESTCTIYGMPKAAVALGGVSAEYPIHELAHAVVAASAGRLNRAS